MHIFVYLAFPPHASAQSKPTNALVDIRDPWAQVERYAEDYYAGGEVINPRLKGPLAAHHLGVHENEDDAAGFLTPDVVSNADFDNDEEREREQEDGEFREEDEEYYDEDVNDEGTRENEGKDINEQDHLFNRLHPSFAYRPFVCTPSPFTGSHYTSH